MGIEQKAESMRLNKAITIFDVWEKILDKRPHIVKQSVILYSLVEHGRKAEEDLAVLPRERITWHLDSGEPGFYGEGKLLKAIGASVEIGPPDLDLTLPTPESSRWYNEGEILHINPEHEKSFIFIDIESKLNGDTIKLFTKALRNWKTDWYILDSGNGSHLIIDGLVPSKDLPRYYGQLIMDTAYNMSPTKSIFYGHIGKCLIDNCGNKDGLRKWTRDILNNFGHVDDPACLGKQVFPIDLRYLAHNIEDIWGKGINRSCLRVSSKHGSVPILRAMQVDKQVVVFGYKNYPFDRKLQRLPGF